ncbi:MAG: orotidine-5'-phosphate decarboxylase [candidate division Zixibacteria bacterium]|nr:orotidine-5'-phosphate decarboxylase [candidate division Zixibacteria bacterium]
MSATSELKKIQEKNKSMLCVGLDLDRKKVPTIYATSIKGLYDFAVRIIAATSDIVAAYKPNLAFFEELGPEGFSLLEKISNRIPDEVPMIIDGKLGDIGSTASHYASAMFERFGADWVTVNPYMGYDSIRPFLEYKDKGAFVLCLTSNPGSRDFQFLHVLNKPIYMYVAEKVAYWDKEQNLGLVVGATHPEQLVDIRKAGGDVPILIPGVGAQGGSLEQAITAGTDNFKKMALINVSRTVIYASPEEDFDKAARAEVEKLNGIINGLRTKITGGQQP